MDTEPGRTLSQTISDKLAEEIVRRQHQPGDRLDEQTLADRFGVSRTPVRDALRHLASTKLVEYLPHRGFSVAAMVASDLEGLFEASGEIEALCAKLCALRATPSELKRVELIHRQAAEAVASDNPKAYAAANEELHSLIYAGAKNKTLEDLAHSLRQRLAPFRSHGFFVAERRLHHSHDEHAAVVGALTARDGEGAARAMRNHSANSAMNVLQHFDGEAPASRGRAITRADA